MTERTLTAIFSEARARCLMEATRGSDWTFAHMTSAEREAFDSWLVEVGHVLASEPGTTEGRFRSFVADLVSGRYRGGLAPGGGTRLLRPWVTLERFALRGTLTGLPTYGVAYDSEAL